MTTLFHYATLREWLSLMALGSCTHAEATLRRCIGASGAAVSPAP